MKFVITAKAENVLRVLQRVISLLTRKRLNVLGMQISDTIWPKISCLSLILQGDEEQIHWLVKQMRKCVDLFDLELEQCPKKEPFHERELCNI